MPVRIIVCGGRDYSDVAFVCATLDRIHRLRTITEIIHGDCETGADFFAKAWAIAREIKQTPCPAEWENLSMPGALIRTNQHGRQYVANAGPIRNGYMLTLQPDGVVAFPGGRGTFDMIRQATDAGVPVYRPLSA